MILLKRFGTNSKLFMKELTNSRKQRLVHQYEMLLEHENTDDMTTRFMHIINQLKSLGKRYSNAEMVRKILRCLSKAWRPNVTVIQEAKDLNVLSLDALIGSLKAHEIELNEVSEESSRRGKFIALKSTQRRASFSKAMKALEKADEEESSNDDDIDEQDEIVNLAHKITKAWIRRKNKKGLPPKKRLQKGKIKTKVRSSTTSVMSLDISNLNVQN